MPKAGEDKGKQGHSGVPSAGAAETSPENQRRTTLPEVTDHTSDMEPAGSEGDKPAAGSPTDPPRKEGKKRLKCEALKGKKIIVGKGEPVQIDENGFFEVDEKEAARLLTIPGYEEA